MRKPVLLAVMSCLIVGPYALAQADSPDKAPKPGTWEFARQEGRRLLLAGQWKEAAEAYGICSGNLLGDVKMVGWNSVRDKPQPEQDRFRFALLSFYFRNMDFSQGSWRYGAREVVEYGRRYQEIIARLPEQQRRDALDFSHLKLLESIDIRCRTNKLTTEDHDKVVAALQANPQSFPAIGAMMLLLEGSPNAKKLITWEEAEQLAKCPLAKLTLARGTRAEAVLPPDTRWRIVEAGLPLIPSAEEKARLLYWTGGNEEGSSPESVDRAIAATRRVYELFPKTVGAAQAREYGAAALVRAGRADEALAFVRRLQEQKNQRRGLDRALLAISTGYADRRQYDKGEPILREVVRDYPETPAAAKAMLGLANVFAARNDRDRERHWLLQCARLENMEMSDRWAQRRDSRTSAIARLACGCERDGQWTEAIRWWQAWKPKLPWCMPGQGDATRHEHIAICRLHLGRYEEAIRSCIDGIESNSALWAFPCDALLFDMYRRADQVDDLLRMVKLIEEDEIKKLLEDPSNGKIFREMSPEKLQKILPTSPIHGLNRIAQLEERRNIPALISICVERRSPGFPTQYAWPLRASAEALARCGDDAVVAIRKAIYAQEEEDRYYNCGWLVYALGKSPSPSTLQILEELARGQFCDSEDLAYAICLKGKAGDAMFDRLIDEGHIWQTDRLRVEAKAVAERSVVPWPSPRPGSLPKTVPPKQPSP